MAIRRCRDKAEWKRLVEEQARSGMSGLAFCEQHGLSRKNFYRNRKVLQQDADSTVNTPSFVQVKPRSAEMIRPTPTPMELTYGEGCLRLPANTDPVWLAQLMKALS
jgi:hypothetical protein